MEHHNTKYGDDEFDGGYSARYHCHVVAGIAAVGSIAAGAMSADAARSAGNKQADAANNASAAQQQATREANAQQWAMYQQNLSNNAPSLQAGQSALSALQNGLGLGRLRAAPGAAPGGPGAAPAQGTYTNSAGQPTDAQGNAITTSTLPGTGPSTNYGATQDELNAAGGSVNSGSLNASYAPSDIQMDPSYQWRLSQGLKALQGSAAAKGGLLTGQGGVDINNYAQGAASQEYQAAYDRNRTSQNDLYNRLASLAGVGQTATGAIGAAGATAAGAMGANTMAGTAASNNYLTSGAAAQAASGVGQANAWGGALNNSANNWMTLQYLNGKNSNQAYNNRPVSNQITLSDGSTFSG